MPSEFLVENETDVRITTAASGWRRALYLWIWVAPVILAVVVFGVMWKPSDPPVKTSTFAFRANDAGGDLRVEWDADSEPIRNAIRGKLEINDGDAPLLIALDTDRLRRGSFFYPRKSSDLDLRMTVYPAQGSPVQEVTKFVAARAAQEPASASSGEAAQLRRERDRLRQEIEQLQAALRKETARNRQLENAMRILNHRAQVERLRVALK